MPAPPALNIFCVAFEVAFTPEPTSLPAKPATLRSPPPALPLINPPTCCTAADTVCITFFATGNALLIADPIQLTNPLSHVPNAICDKI